jgi:hypothetical protein
MFSMIILAIRLPVVIVVAAPVIVDLLTGPCYLDSKSHSLLMNCGAELFSLEDFFASAYACNGHFWRIIAIAGNFLQPGFAQTFLNGITAMGENSGISAFMPGIIGAMSKVSNNDPTEGVTKIQDTVAGGSRFGPATMFMKLSVNPIAGAHWMWRIGSGIIVQIIQAVKAERSIGSVFWNVVYDGRVDYNDLIASRMLNTCGGFALMAGYSTPLGNMILHYCFAGVKSTMATLDLLSVFLVDMPIIVCVCKSISGNNPADWIINNCDSPDGFKPLLRRIMDSPTQCADLVANTNANLTGVFDDVFGELFAGTTSTGSILDSFLAAVDPKNAGQCDNFDSNPYVVTIIPEPADYWRVCGNTDFCKLRCQQQMQAFAQVQPSSGSVRSSTTEQAVQSLFFPTLNADAYNPFSSVVAIIEMEKCYTEPEDRCFIMAGFVSSRLQVAQFTVPSSLSRGVSKSNSWDTYGISGLSTYIQFIRTSIGDWEDTYCVVGMQDQLVSVCTRLTCTDFVPTDLDTDVLGFQQMQSLNDNNVLFQVRTTSEGMQTYSLSFQAAVWQFIRCTTNIWDNSMYHLVATASGQMMLLPFDDVPLQLCTVMGTTLSSCTQFEGFQKQNVPVKTKGLQSRVSQYTSKDYSIFIASNDPSHWLTMLFVSIEGTYASAGVGNSMSVSMQYTIAQTCSLDSCIGCTQLAVQRLCFAAQRCQVARCVGSQVNQLRPLCAVGGALESSLFSFLAAAQGIWSMISSTLVTILDASGGISPPSTITWPDQIFYGMVCSMKDMVASQVSIITSMINGIVQSSMAVQPMSMGDTLDNSFLATFTLTMTAVTKFLYQLALGPLYGAIAVQKVLVCQTNSLVAVVSGNNKVTIGDPSIQSATGAATGVCMSQVMGENAQGLNSGMDNNKAFTSGSTQVISQIGGLALSLPLDALRHPMDATFTYILGVVRGLQDILQTADQRK